MLVYYITGTPNRPIIEKVAFGEGAITLSWTIAKHELRPVQRYTLTLQATEPESDETVVYNNPGPDRRSSPVSEEKKEKEVRRLSLTNINNLCTFDASSKSDMCQYTLQQSVQLGEVYNITLCAVNEFGLSCGNVKKAVANKGSPSSAGNLSPGEKDDDDDGDFSKSILWVIVGFLAAILLGCSLLVCLVLHSAVAALTKQKNGSKQHGVNYKDSERCSLSLSHSLSMGYPTCADIYDIVTLIRCLHAVSICHAI